MKKIIAMLLIASMALVCAVSVATAAGSAPTDASRLTFNADSARYFTGANNTKVSVVTDDTDSGYSVKLESSGTLTDPYVMFSYKTYVNALKLTAPKADDIKYIVLKIRQQYCANSMFEIFYCTSGGVSVPTGGYSVTTNYEIGTDDWQYVVFGTDGRQGWKGDINSFRIDWQLNASSAGEAIYIDQFMLVKSYEELQTIVKPEGGSGVDLHALAQYQQAQADFLLANATDPAPEVSNEPLTAEYEDKDLVMWFDHSYYKTPGETVTSNGKNTYQMRMAKNEIECAQMVLASSKAYSDLTVEVTDFVNGDARLTPRLYYGYYFDDVEGKSIVDPIPALTDPISLTANKSQLFLIKLKTEKDTPAGQYQATLSVKDKDGKEIKRANVYAYVWDFALPDASNVKTLADLGWYSIYAMDNVNGTLYGDDNGCKCGEDLPEFHFHSGTTYKAFYDLLLENKMNAYNMPYVEEAQYTDGDDFDRQTIIDYLNDPRVQAFNPIGYSKAPSQSNIQRAYNFLSQDPEWLKKAYFYTVDEPMDKAALDSVRSHAQMIKSVFGDGYKLITPMHLNNIYDREYKVDAFEYVNGYTNVWCPHTFFFNTYADKKANPLLTYRSAKKVEENLGTFPERMAKAQQNGEEVWWYVTRYPHYPEITLSISDPAVDHRILFWQQKLYNVDGFLYYSVNDWYQKASDGTWGWEKKKEVSTDSYTPYTVYGNGVLVYHGGKINKFHEAVGSMRLEQIRDGIEDYDYFTLLDEKYGEGTSELLIKQVTTSLGNFKSDVDLFTQIRIATGNLIAGEKLDIPKGKPGDVNRDEKVNNKDVSALFKYMSGDTSVDVDLIACDCNGDGKVNNKDVTHLFKYVSGQDVELFYGVPEPEIPDEPETRETYEFNGVTIELPPDYSIESVNGIPTGKHMSSVTDTFNFALSGAGTLSGLTKDSFLAIYKNQGFDASCTGWTSYQVDGKNVNRGDFTLRVSGVETYATVLIISASAGDVMMSFARMSETYAQDYEEIIGSLRVK